MRLLVVLFLSLSLSANVFACFGPIQSDEYDALIQINKVKKNKYSYEFPSVLHGYKNDGSVTLVLSQERGPIKVDSPHMELTPVEVNGVMKGEFLIPEAESHVFLIVSWPPEQECCLCAFLAFSEIAYRE